MVPSRIGGTRPQKDRSWATLPSSFFTKKSDPGRGGLSQDISSGFRFGSHVGNAVQVIRQVVDLDDI